MWKERHPAEETDPRRWAEYYTARGYAVVPLAAGKKRPALKGLPTGRLTTAQIDRYVSTSSNLGLRCGAPSGGLVDIDGDSREAVALFPILLPPTGMRHGRRGNVGSHRWYRCSQPPKSTKFSDPSGRVLVEIRGTGATTMAPPSIHPCGEPLRWEAEDDAAAVSGDELATAVAKVAAGALLAKRWPRKGRRHDMALALAGFLARRGMATEDAQRFVAAVARVGGDEEWEARRGDVASTQTRLSEGGPATGAPTLAGLLGRDGDLVVALITKWLRFGTAAQAPQGGIDITTHHLPTLATQTWACAFRPIVTTQIGAS